MPIEIAIHQNIYHKVKVVHEVYEILEIQVFHAVNNFHDIKKIYESLQNFGAQPVTQGISDVKIKLYDMGSQLHSTFCWLDGTYYIGKNLRKEVTCPKRQLPVLRNVLSSSSSRSSEEKWEITNKKLRRIWGEAPKTEV